MDSHLKCNSVPKEFGWSLKAQAFTGCIVIRSDHFNEAIVREGGQVGFSGQGTTHAADGVFNAAFLPRRIGVTEEGLDIQRMEVVVAGELGAIVKGDCLAPGSGSGARMSRMALAIGSAALLGGRTAMSRRE